MFDIKTLGRLVAAAATRIAGLEAQFEAQKRIIEVANGTAAREESRSKELNKQIERLERDIYGLNNELRASQSSLNAAKHAYTSDIKKEGLYIVGGILGAGCVHLTQEDIKKVTEQLKGLYVVGLLPTRLRVIDAIRHQRRLGLKEAKDYVDVVWPLGVPLDGSSLEGPKDSSVRTFCNTEAQ